MATDNNFAIKKFINKFNSDIFYSQATRKNNQFTSRGIHDSRLNKAFNIFTHHGHKMALDVLEDGHILSRCSGLVCGHSNVSDAAICMKKRSF